MPASNTDDLDVTVESCTEALQLMQPGTYDCIQSNLALLVNAARGRGASLRLGAELTILPRRLACGLYTVDPEPAAEISRCSRLLDFTADTAVAARGAAGLRESVNAIGGVCYVVGDAFSMPWLPYFGQVHMPHSFLVSARPGQHAIVVDAYDNRTEWGAAEPGAWNTPWSELSFPVHIWKWQIMKRTTPVQTRIERRGVEAYIAAFKAHKDRVRVWEQLAVETWALARRHTLFSYSHDHDTALGPAAGAAAASWQRLAADVFLGYRRMRSGRPEPPNAFNELERLLTQPF